MARSIAILAFLLAFWRAVGARLIPDSTRASVMDVAINLQVTDIVVAAINVTELAHTLSSKGPFTIFTPSDEAFATALATLGLTPEELLARPDLASILAYHVIPGRLLIKDLEDGQQLTTVNGASLTVAVDNMGRAYINDAEIVTADEEAENGVVHVIDAVLLTQEDETTSLETATLIPATVIEAAINSRVSNLIMAAISVTELAHTLSSKGPFTIFAPNDNAFVAALATLGLSLEELLAKPDLASILGSHVIPGRLLKKDLVDGRQLATVNGASLTVAADNMGHVYIGNAKVLTADEEAENGVVHVIDAVLLRAATTVE